MVTVLREVGYRGSSYDQMVINDSDVIQEPTNHLQV